MFGAFTLINLVFSAASSLKFVEGGFIPLTIGLAVFAVMRTWRWGRKATFAAYTAVPTMNHAGPGAARSVEQSYLQRVALLMTPKHLASLDDNAPALLQILFQRYGMLPRHLIFVEVAHAKTPYVHDDRYRVAVSVVATRRASSQ